MKQRILRMVLCTFFAVLIATPVVIKRLSERHASSGTAIHPDTVMARYGFCFQEVAKAAGLEFTHQAPTLDPQLAHIMPQVAAMGAAVSIVDVDRDGWQDIYVTNSSEGSHNHLYRNLGDGTFQDVAVAMGVASVNQEGTGVSMGAVWGDYDNDGYEDLFLYKWGRPELFRNDQGHRFVRVTAPGLPRWINANTAVWLDYDRDGWLDLFIGGYFAEHINLWQLTTTRIMPESFEYAHNGGRKYLLRNRGDGSFADVTEQLGITSRRWALAATAADLRGTGYSDLFIANDYGVSELYFNDGGARFREVGKQTGVGFAPKSGMNAAVGDIFNQGQFAIYVTNISEAGILLQGNNLWVPKTGTAGEHPTYDNLARTMGVELGGWSFGAQFGDLNNDGYLDLYLTNGYISADRDRSYWYDFSKVAGGNTTIIADAQNWPPMEGRSLSGYQQKRVWINDGAGQFFDVAPVVGVTDTYDGRAVALADLWNRGVLDVVVANQKGPLLLYKNTVVVDNQWIAFTLEGSVSNRSAIGAQVRLFWNGHEQVQEVSGGSGFGAQNQRPLHFGLGKHPGIEKAVIRWPSGQVQTLIAPQIGQVHQVKEAKGF
jgi:hypothetical protein